MGLAGAWWPSLLGTIRVLGLALDAGQAYALEPTRFEAGSKVPLQQIAGNWHLEEGGDELVFDCS